MIKILNLKGAANYAHRLGAHQTTADEMGHFQDTFKSIVEGYRRSDLAISGSLELERFQPFLDWLPWLQSNYNKVVPLLVGNMIEGDIYSRKIYEIMHAGNDHFIVSLYEVANNEALRNLFHQAGKAGCHHGFGFIEAERWLSSSQAAEIANKLDESTVSHVGHDNLCAANSLLGVSNSYIDCDH